MKIEDIKKVYLATDHAGLDMKNSLKEYLVSNYNFDIVDLGSDVYDQADNYTDYIHKAGKALSQDMKNNSSVESYATDIHSVAFVFGGSGEGEAMVMNRYSDIRCTTYYGGNLDIIKLGREHNNANSISFGARFLDIEECKKAVEIFFTTDFIFGNHLKRIQDIDLLF